MSDWLIMLSEAVLVLSFIQSIIWHNNYIAGPRLRHNLSRKKPFSDLIQEDFYLVQLDNTQQAKLARKGVIVLISKVDGYAVEISFSYLAGWLESPYYVVRVFFNTDNLTHNELITCRQNILARSKFFAWNDSIKLTATHVEQRLGVGKFVKPSGESLMNAARQLVTELQKLGLYSVNYEEGVNNQIINQE